MALNSCRLTSGSDTAALSAPGKSIRAADVRLRFSYCIMKESEERKGQSLRHQSLRRLVFVQDKPYACFLIHQSARGMRAALFQEYFISPSTELTQDGSLFQLQWQMWFKVAVAGMNKDSYLCIFFKFCDAGESQTEGGIRFEGDITHTALHTSKICIPASAQVLAGCVDAP